MAVPNAEIARIFEEVADLLEVSGANPFRVRAYRAAAETVRGLSSPLHARVRAGDDLSELPDIGTDLAGKIAEIVRTGRLGLLEELRSTTPSGVLELRSLPGIGPKRARALHEALGVTSRAELLEEARRGHVRTVKGLGEKTEQRILAALGGHDEPARERLPRHEAVPVARTLLQRLRAAPGVSTVEVAGSYRRQCETVGDLDLLVAAERGEPVVERFTRQGEVAEVLASGATKASVVLRSGLQVDLRVVPRASFGAALVYFTGSKAHTIALRRIARAQGLKLNEYGVYRGSRRLAGRTEAEVYRALGLEPVAPELREDRGEVEAARAGNLPRLLEPEDVRGDLHAHTKASDGRSSLEAMARAADDLGYEYLAVTDHTRAAGGLEPAALRRQLAEIESLAGRFPGLRLLRSAEVEILEDGRLDLPDALLAELDLVVCGVHTALGLSRKKQTSRLLRALDHPRCHVLAHPAGRRVGSRARMDVDLDRLLAAAAERRCILELNARPERLDLPDVHLAAAAEAGLRIAVSSDAHAAHELEWMAEGVGYGRRGWLRAEDVVNTRPWEEVRTLLRA